MTRRRGANGIPAGPSGPAFGVSGSAPSRAILIGFRAIYLVGAALCLLAGTLVTASLFIADRAPQSSTFLGISIAMSAIFLAIVGVFWYPIRSIMRKRRAAAEQQAHQKDPTE